MKLKAENRSGIGNNAHSLKVHTIKS